MTTPPVSPAPPPQPQTSFVGRETELAAIAARLADPACRLLTLVGPGGIGKTRLALEVTARQRDRYPDGAVFVPLQALEKTEHIVQAVADALGLYLGSAIDPCCELMERLGDLHLLLVLDNFEHLLDSVDFVVDLLPAAPGIQVLVTSREPLNLREEWLWPVTGLSYPDGSAHAELASEALGDAYPAVQLFVQRARRTRPAFDLAEEWAGVVRICTLVEGLPLAIELAATWVGALTCAEIADELAHSLDILESRTRNMPARHRSMRVVLTQSWERLPRPSATSSSGWRSFGAASRGRRRGPWRARVCRCCWPWWKNPCCATWKTAATTCTSWSASSRRSSSAPRSRT